MLVKGIHGGDIYRNKVCMDYSVNINPLGMPDGLKKTLYEAVEKCCEYPDIEAAMLKQKVGKSYNIPEDYLLFGNGASDLLMGIVHAIKPKKALIPVPSFYGYEYACKAVDSNIEYLILKEENDFLPKEDSYKQLTKDIDIVFLANPNNPTGMKLDKKYLRRLLDICKEKGIFVVLDECFVEFCGNEFSMLSDIIKYNNLLIVRAFTKIYAIPGVRLGYLVCSNDSLLEKIRRQLGEWNLSTFAQAAGIMCIEKKEYIKNTIEYLNSERLYLFEELKKLGIRVFKGEANFILIYCDIDLYDKLIDKGILIRDCENFNGLTKGYYRIAIKKHEDNEKLLAAIKECFICTK